MAVENETDPLELDDALDEEALGDETDDDGLEEDAEDPEGREEEDHEGDDDGPEGRTGQVAERPAKRGRANETIRTLREQSQTLRRELDDLKRQSEFQQRNVVQQRNAEAEEAERQRVLLMTPDERADYRIEQMRNEMRGNQQRLELQLAEQADRVAFETKAQSNPVYKKFAPAVEKRLSDLRAQGQNVPREVLMKFIIGEAALEKAQAAAARQGKRAQGQARSQQGRASNPRGQQQAEGRRSGKTARERLEGIKF